MVCTPIISHSVDIEVVGVNEPLVKFSNSRAVTLWDLSASVIGSMLATQIRFNRALSRLAYESGKLL